MPKSPSFPILLDNTKIISTSFLKQYGYLKPYQIKSGIVTWSVNGNKLGSISIQVNTQVKMYYLELDYKCNNVPIKYRVQLIPSESNLGKGIVWFFVCPKTGMRCRKLYLVDTYFYHRAAFKGCMYQKQIESKKFRGLSKTMGGYFQLDELYRQLYRKNFKKIYAGKPTKKYLTLTNLINQGEKITTTDVELALLF